jgi:hypothetical protein
MQRERQIKTQKESEGASNTYILESAEEVQVRNTKEYKRREAERLSHSAEQRGRDKSGTAKETKEDTYPLKSTEGVTS